jgi:hypothetical protein
MGISGMKSIKIYKPGTKIILSKDINATIDRVTILPCGSFIYTVVWWNGRERKEAPIYEYEIIQCEQEKITIGFK